MPESPIPLARLRARLADATAAACPRRLFALGAEAVDAALGGGLPAARLHEIVPAEAGDTATAAAFALMLAARAAGGDAPILWIKERHAPRLYPPGIADLGIDPGRLLMIEVPDATALLRTAADGLRSPAIGAIVLAPARRLTGLDLTGSRRLTLAAEAGGGTAIALRACGDDTPSAAASRWRIAAEPSTPIEASAPGHPVFLADLLRHRFGAAEGGWLLTWDRTDARFHLFPAIASHGTPAFVVQRRLMLVPGADRRDEPWPIRARA